MVVVMVVVVSSTTVANPSTAAVDLVLGHVTLQVRLLSV
jgi:hypothetical protein